MADKLVLDLETKKSFDEVGGYDNIHLMEVSVCGVYSYERDQYRAFRESEFGEMEEWLKKSELVIGFNSKKFDFTVLQPYYKWKLDKLPHLDIMEEIVHALGHRLKLESVAMSTLGSGKSGSGLDALLYYKNQEWDKLSKYCLDDVRVTREVYEYGQKHGQLWYEKSKKKTAIPIRWGIEKKISDILQDAMTFGKKVKLTYLNPNGQPRLETEVDVKDVKGNILFAFCHTENQDKQFEIHRIFDIDTLGKANSFQEQLF